MENRYRVILSNNTLYKEIEIPEDKIKFSVGTEIECDFRLRREYFFDKIMLFFDGKSPNMDETTSYWYTDIELIFE